MLSLLLPVYRGCDFWTWISGQKLFFYISWSSVWTWRKSKKSYCHWNILNNTYTGIPCNTRRWSVKWGVNLQARVTSIKLEGKLKRGWAIYERLARYGVKMMQRQLETSNPLTSAGTEIYSQLKVLPLFSTSEMGYVYDF